VILGAVVSRDASLLADLRAWRSSGGGIPGPFEAWLALRGLKTLPLRIARQSASALAVADHLAGHPRVILPATSFGGVESTWERRARWPAETAPPGLIRLSVGVEPAADLITDIDQALGVL